MTKLLAIGISTVVFAMLFVIRIEEGAERGISVVVERQQGESAISIIEDRERPISSGTRLSRGAAIETRGDYLEVYKKPGSIIELADHTRIKLVSLDERATISLPGGRIIVYGILPVRIETPSVSLEAESGIFSVVVYPNQDVQIIPINVDVTIHHDSFGTRTISLPATWDEANQRLTYELEPFRPDASAAKDFYQWAGGK